MAFVPIGSSFGLIRSGSLCSTDFCPSTSTTYVYSRPVTSICPSNIIFSQQERPRLNITGTRTQAMQPEGVQDLGYQVEEQIRQRRTQFTAYQREELEGIFSRSQYITPQRRQSLSQELGIPQEVILTWFKNRRAKWRKEHRRSDMKPADRCFATGLYCRYFGHVPYPNSSVMMKDARMLHARTAYGSYHEALV